MLTIYLSDRKLPLVFTGVAELRPVLTVENYCKWYTLWLVGTDGSVTEVEFPDPPGFQDSYCHDHVPNPEAVALFANQQDYDVDDQSMEMIIGRWEREAKGNYSYSYTS